ncbi:MAG: zinc-ribbon domain-containing protein [Deltaproteobacteria bacterium]|nr:zinc-ribbon domain-containing protein [Deltaproteobacteria bacterium]
MKFSCNSCNARYNLPDEKFAGKVITLTCKKCGVKIVVKPSNPSHGMQSQKEGSNLGTSLVAADLQIEKSTKRQELKRKDLTTRSTVGEKRYDKSFEGDKALEKGVSSVRMDVKKVGEVDSIRSVDERYKGVKGKEERLERNREVKSEKLEEEDKELAVWYYSRGGEQKGPFTDEEIRELVESNVITPKTFIWKDGMLDWMRASTVVEFKHFFEGKPSKEPVVKEVVESLGLEELDKKFKDQKVGERIQEVDVLGSEGADKGGGTQEDFFSIGFGQNTQKSPEEDWTKIPLSNEVSEEPRENTRIVIMKAGLSEAAKKKRVIMGIVVAVFLLSVFLFVFIRNLEPILSAVGVQVKSGIDLEMEDLDKDTLSKMTPEEQEKYRKALLGIKETKKLTKEQKRTIAMAITQRKDSDMVSILESAKVDTSSIIYDNLGRERMGPQGGITTSVDIDSRLANLGINTKIEGVDLSSRGIKQDVDLSQKLPDKVDTLSEDIVMSIVNKNRSSVKYCYERHLRASSFLEGKAVFKITIHNSGSVSKVDSLSKQISGSLFEDCIIKEIRKWVFPKFSGDPIVFEIPFVLTSVN